MKCSRQFATHAGQSHHIAKMANVSAAYFIRTLTLEGETKVTLQIERSDREKPTYLKVRMSIAEARRLSDDLNRVLENGEL